MKGLDKAPRRRLDAGESARMAGIMMGRAIAAERKRNQRFFAALWVAWAVLAIVALFA